MLSRRSMLFGIGAVIAAPAVIRTPGVLMKVRPLSTSLAVPPLLRTFDLDAYAMMFEVQRRPLEPDASLRQRTLSAIKNPERVVQLPSF